MALGAPAGDVLVLGDGAGGGGKVGLLLVEEGRGGCSGVVEAGLGNAGGTWLLLLLEERAMMSEGDVFVGYG